MKNEPLGQAARDTSKKPLREAVALPFRIVALRRVAYGPKAEEKPAERKPQSVAPSETLLESERRFEAAFEKLDAGNGAT